MSFRKRPFFSTTPAMYILNTAATHLFIYILYIGGLSIWIKYTHITNTSDIHPWVTVVGIVLYYICNWFSEKNWPMHFDKRYKLVMIILNLAMYAILVINLRYILLN